MNKQNILCHNKTMKLLLFALIFFLFFSPAAFSQMDHEENKRPALSSEANYYYIIGYQAALSYDWDKAINNYKKALEFDPQSTYLKTQIGYALYHSGRASEAIIVLEEVLKELPDNMSVLLLAGEIYKNQLRVQDAIDIYQRIIKIAPDNNAALFLLGGLYYYNNELDSAASLLEGLLVREPEAYHVLDLLGAIYMDKKEYEKAAGHLKKAVAFNPAFESAYLKLGIISEISGDFSGALDNYNKALNINPDNFQTRDRVVQIYLKQKDTDRAIEELVVMSKKYPGNAGIHVKLGMIYFEAKQFENAMKEFNIALEDSEFQDHQGNVTLRYYLSLVLAEMERHEEAVVELKKILQKEPKNINAFLHLAFVYSKMKRDADTVKVYKELLEFESDNPNIYLYLVNAYVRLKKYAEAEALLSEAFLKFKKNDELHFALAVVFEKTGRFTAMVEELRKAIAINPKNADALNYLGYSFAEKSIHLSEAYDLITRALDIKPNSGYILDSLGWVYYRQGRYESALKVLLKAVEITKDDAVIMEHLGDVYKELGAAEKAIECWEKSLSFSEIEEGLKDRVEQKIRNLKSASGK